MKILRLALCALLITSVATWAAEAPSDLPQAALTLGAQGGEGEFEVYGDILVPVYLTENGLWSVNPRASASDNDEEEANLGVVYRHLLPEKNVIIGGNVYYDSRWTQHDNHFNQLGLGLEVLTEWVDARANYYLPESGEELVDRFTAQTVEVETYTHWNDPYATGHEIRQTGYKRTTTTTTTYLFERFEQAREGWDAEIGVKLPGLDDIAEVRVFGGYYNWDAEYSGRDEIEGWKGRVEARIAPIFYLDAGVFEDAELSGSDWYVGGRVNVAFDQKALADGNNPFADSLEKGERKFSDRLFEMVIRDLKIQTETSDYMEKQEARTVDVDVDQKNYDDELLDDVTFVDDDADDDPGPDDPTISDPNESGSAEHPYDEIQEGVDNAMSPVFVFEGNYDENVVVNKDVELIGSGYPIGNAGMTLGSGWPTVNGWDAVALTADPAFFIDGPGGAVNVSIAGFDILSSENGMYDENAVIGLAAVSVDGVARFDFHHNQVRDAAIGVLAGGNAAAPEFDYSIHDNTFYRLGVGVAAGTENGVGRVTIQDNFFRETGVGIIAGALDAGGPRSLVDVTITGNDIQSGGINPVLGILNNVNTGPIPPLPPPPFLPAGFLPLPEEFPSVGGIGVFSQGRSTVNANISGNIIDDNILGIAGVAIGNASEARLNVNIANNDIKGGGTAAVLDHFGLDTLDDLSPPLPGPLPPIPIAGLDLSLGGILLVAADRSEVNANVTGNEVSKQLLGLGAVTWGPLSRMELDVENNTINDALLGAAVVGVDQARVGLEFNNNVLRGGGLNPLLDFGLGGLLVVAYDDTYINDVVINNNTFDDFIVGVGIAAADGDSRMNRAEIGGNNINAVLGIYGGSYGPAAQMNVANIHDNVIGPANLGIDLGLLGGTEIDLGVAGILMFGTDDARVNNLTIDDNVVDDHLIGVAVAGIGGVRHNNLTITDNSINDTLLGVLAFSEGNAADMDNLVVSGNNITGGAGPLGILPDDMGLAGIVVAGWNEPTIRNALITDNNVSDTLLGIGAIGYDDVNMNNMEIGGNNLNNTAVGVVAALIDNSSANNLWIHDNNLSAMDIGLLGADAGLAGIVALGATDVAMNNVDISDNNMDGYLLGTALAGIGNVDLDNANISDNNIQNTSIGVLGFIEGAGSMFRNVTVNDNTITGDNQLDGLLGLDINGGIAGILMAGWNEPNMRFMEITGNNVNNTLLGIGAVGFDEVNLNDLEIGNNNLNNVGIGALAGVIGLNSTMNNLWIHDNTINGNGQGLLPGLIPGAPNAGWAGVLAFTFDDAKANAAVIDNNVINNELLGIGFVGISGGIMNGGQISNNEIDDALIGILALSEGNGAEMINLDIFNNTTDGKYLADIAALIDPAFDAPNAGLAGIVVAGWNEPTMSGLDIYDNVVEEAALGIGIIGYDDVVMNNANINNNTIINPVVGIAAASIDGSQVRVDIFDNVLSVNPGYDYGDIPTFLDTVWNTFIPVPLPGTAPAGILVIGAGLNTSIFDIYDNDMNGFNVGVLAASLNGEDVIIGGNWSDNGAQNWYTGLPADLTDIGNNLVDGVVDPVQTFP